MRRGVVQGANLADTLDLKWERFSDSLRDEKKRDPMKNHRLFDNGVRRDKHSPNSKLDARVVMGKGTSDGFRSIAPTLGTTSHLMRLSLLFFLRKTGGW